MENSLVGQFLRFPSPSYQAVQTMVNKFWKLLGLYKIFVMNNGMYVFSFKEDFGCLKVLERAHVKNIPLLLRRWAPDLDLEKFTPEAVPVWVRVSNIPMAMWSKKGLGGIAGKIGKPLAVDSITAQDEKLGFASLYVIVNLDHELKTELPMQILGKMHKIKVEYLNLSEKCALCNQLGHAGPACNSHLNVELGHDAVTTERHLTDEVLEGTVRGRSVKRRGCSRRRRYKNSVQSPHQIINRDSTTVESITTSPNELQNPSLNENMSREPLEHIKRTHSRFRSTEKRVWV